MREHRAHEAIRRDTIRGLAEHQHQLAAYCARCQRWAVLDLAKLMEQGRGDYVFVGRTPRCSDCGSAGE
jgi:hypothetical protein